MKLKEKLALLTAVAIIGVIAVYLGSAMSTRCDRAANESLTEAKQTLAKQLKTSPDKLTEYWSGIYEGTERFRYYSSDDTETGDYEAHVRSVEPHFRDRIIEDETVRGMVSEAINKQYASDRWRDFCYLGLFANVISLAIAVFNVVRVANRATVVA